MPWDVAFTNASPYVIALVLIWLIAQMFKFIERLLERLDDFRETIDYSITALQVAAETQRDLARREEQSIDVQRELCNRISHMEERLTGGTR
jgi:hypothetical protein